jgi:hypothetical protein
MSSPPGREGKTLNWQNWSRLSPRSAFSISRLDAHSKEAKRLFKNLGNANKFSLSFFMLGFLCIEYFMFMHVMNDNLQTRHKLPVIYTAPSTKTTTARSPRVFARTFPPSRAETLHKENAESLLDEPGGEVNELCTKFIFKAYQRAKKGEEEHRNVE